MAVVGWILLALLGLYEWILIARAIMSWVQVINPRWTPHGLLLVLAEGCYTLTDPPLKWLRKLIRPLRIGNVQLDLAFFVLFLLVIVVSRVVSSVFFL